MKTLVIASHGRKLGWSVDSTSGAPDSKGRFLYCNQEAFWYPSYEAALTGFKASDGEILLPGKYTYNDQTQKLHPW